MRQSNAWHLVGCGTSAKLTSSTPKTVLEPARRRLSSLLSKEGESLTGDTRVAEDGEIAHASIEGSPAGFLHAPAAGGSAPRGSRRPARPAGDAGRVPSGRGRVVLRSRLP